MMGPRHAQPPAFDLVALDLDGTLLDSQARISAGNAAAVTACHAAGVRVTLATGKLLVSARAMCRQLGLVEPQITANGAALMGLQPEGVLAVSPLPPAGCQEVLRALRGYGLPAAAYTPFAIYTWQTDPRLDAIVAIHEPEPIVLSDLATLPVVAGHPFIKILTVLDQSHPATAEFEALLRDRFAEHLTVVRTSRLFFEFLALGVSKGVALRRLADLRGIAMSRVLAIGDSYNDLPLLAAAGLGVAMGHAPAELRAIAGAVTLDNDHDGVAAAIYRYVLPHLGPGR